MRTLLASSLAVLLSTTACTDDTSPMSMEEETEPQPEQMTPAIGVSAPQSLRIVRGQSTPLTISITRSGGFTGPVTIKATDLPIGVTAEPITIAEGETAGVLTLVGTQSIVLATYGTMTVDATAGELTASAPTELHMTDPSGALDVTFAITGKKNFSFTAASNENAHAVAVQPDDKIIVGAVDQLAKGYNLLRLLPNGDLDPDFGTGGRIVIPDGNAVQQVAGVFVRGDGTILLVVRADVNTIVYAFDSSGTLLAGWGNIGSGATILAPGTIGMTFHTTTAALASDGGLALGSGTLDMKVARLDANGLPIPAFDGDGVAVVDLGGSSEGMYAMGLRPDGRIVVAGSIWDGMNHMAVAQLTADGQLDTSFSNDGKLVINTGVNNGFDELAVLPDGRVALNAAESGTNTVAVLKANGDIDTSFSGDGFAAAAFGDIGGLIATADGIYVAGSVIGSKKFQVGKLGMDGLAMSNFGIDGLSSISMGPNENHYLHAMALDSHGRLVAVGFNYAGAESGQIAVTRFWQ